MRSSIRTSTDSLASPANRRSTQRTRGFLAFDELISDQRDCAILFEFDSRQNTLSIQAHSHIDHDSDPSTASLLYVMSHNVSKPTLDTSTLVESLEQPPLSQFFVYDPKNKPYKPVAKKV